MARYADRTDTLVAGLEVPLGGVSVYVYDQDEALAELTEDEGGTLLNPVTSDSAGNFHFNAADGVYTLEYHYGGQRIDREQGVIVGTGLSDFDNRVQALIDNTVTTVTAASYAPGSPIRQNVTPALNPHAYLYRAPPPNMVNLPLMPVLVRGAGDVVVNGTALGAFISAHPDVATGAVAYVNLTTGNDGTGVLNDETHKFASVNYVLRSTTAQWILCDDGAYNIADYRASDQSGTAKVVLARNPGRASFRVPGDDVTTKTFTATGGQAGVWETTIASGIAGTTDRIQRLVRTDMLDPWGYPLTFRLYASVAALQAAGYGFFYDTATDKLYVAASGADINTIKRLLRAYYVEAVAGTPGNAALSCRGVPLFVDGFVLDGVWAWGLELDLGGGDVRGPDLWLSNFKAQYSVGYGASLETGGRLVLSNGRMHSSTLDAANTNYSTSNGGLLLRSNIYTSNSGDPATFGTGIAQNNQGAAAHGGIHVSMGCIDEGNYGQEFADASSPTGIANITWVVGCFARFSALSSAARTGYQFIGKGSAGSDNRIAYLDTCTVRSEGTHPLYLTAYAAAKIYDCDFDGIAPVAETGSVAPVAYDPTAP